MCKAPQPMWVRSCIQSRRSETEKKIVASKQNGEKSDTICVYQNWEKKKKAKTNVARKKAVGNHKEGKRWWVYIVRAERREILYSVCKDCSGYEGGGGRTTALLAALHVDTSPFSPRRIVSNMRQSCANPLKQQRAVLVLVPPFSLSPPLLSWVGRFRRHRFSFKLKFKLGRQNKNKKGGRKKKEKSNDKHKRLFGEMRETISSLSGCNNIQGTESFKNDFLIHVMCLCVCVEKR